MPSQGHRPPTPSSRGAGSDQDPNSLPLLPPPRLPCPAEAASACLCVCVVVGGRQKGDIFPQMGHGPAVPGDRPSSRLPPLVLVSHGSARAPRPCRCRPPTWRLPGVERASVCRWLSRWKSRKHGAFYKIPTIPRKSERSACGRRSLKLFSPPPPSPRR